MDEGSRIWIGYSYDFGRWILLDVAYIRLEDGDVRDEKNTISYRKTIEGRKSFKKDHPGYRLAFRDRFPNLPFYLSVTAIVISSVQLWIALWR